MGKCFVRLEAVLVTKYLKFECARAIRILKRTVDKLGKIHFQSAFSIFCLQRLRDFQKVVAIDTARVCMFVCVLKTYN